MPGTITPPRPGERDLVLSGGFGKSTNSARAGFLPVALERVPLPALHGISVYIRVRPDEAERAGGADHDEHFRLYSAPEIRMAEVHRRRLVDMGVRFVYIRMADQSRFRRQTEEHLRTAAEDPALALAEKSALIYETSVELVNELLAEPQLAAKSPRLEQVSRAITTLVMNNPNAFTHLFAASHHDFYTATHMVNVATWMVPLAYMLGHRDPDELSVICQAGILHDMGKLVVPESVLNKPGKLSDEDWAAIRRHPEAGCEYLSRFEGVNPIILTVTRQHHERMDGTGYPDRLTGDQIHPISRICAVVDSFDAMTAFRPFKDRTLTVEATMEILRKETPAKYDPAVMEAWTALVRSAERAGAGPIGMAAPSGADRTRRRHERRSFHCPARAHLLVRAASGVVERPAIPVVAHSISRSGLGFLSQQPIQPGEFVRIYLNAQGWQDRPVEGHTVRCRQHSDCWHEVGLEFGSIDAVHVPPTTAAAA